MMNRIPEKELVHDDVSFSEISLNNGRWQDDDADVRWFPSRRMGRRSPGIAGWLYTSGCAN